MPAEMENTLTLDSFAEELALSISLLTPKYEQPLDRYMLYQAYASLVSLVEYRGAMPENYQPFKAGIEEIKEWIKRGGNLGKRLLDEIRRLLKALQDAGSSVIDDLCSFWCTYKKALKTSNDALSLAAYTTQIKAILLAYGGDILYAGGVPLTAFAAILLHSGVLEEFCEC